MLAYLRNLLFTQDGFTLHIERAEKFGGALSITSADELEKLFAAGAVHPLDLKQAASKAIADYLEPVRKYFTDNPEAAQSYQEIAEFQITR